MKKFIMLPFVALISCGPSQNEINSKRINDSLIVAMRNKEIKDSIHKVNSLRISDSITAEIIKATEGINNLGK